MNEYTGEDWLTKKSSAEIEEIKAQEKKEL